ncbi:MAG: glycine--tRNA ligase [Planctomycetes bacterium]|nr:glycine--tRNA ligase [Planctomycetota bacterium]
MLKSFDVLQSLCKRRGFIFQSSEIYGGLASCWDYGPLGVELKNNIKKLWWKSMVHNRQDIVGLDSSILMNPQVWIASGHVENFNDPMVDCKSCKARFRQDELPAEKLKEKTCIKCGNKGTLTEPRQFNLMFRTFMGPVEDEGARVYLRPETAQGIFVNFVNVQTTTRKKLPFGIAQMGKSFRNEITPKNFIFRTREFEQMEMEFFVMPGDDEKWHKYWVDERFNWYTKLGINKNKLRIRPHGKDELSHYSKATSDIEYEFPIGWSEIEGIANRTDFDLKQHAKHSKQELSYFDPEQNKHITPYVIEPAAGVDRLFLTFMTDSYTEEKVKDETRVALKLHYELAPIKFAVLPLLKKRNDIVELATKLRNELNSIGYSVYDDTASIGKLYRRQDEIGTPYCVTVDVQTVEEDKKVTIRERDTMEQIRVPTDQLLSVTHDLATKGWTETTKTIPKWTNQST